MSALSPETIEAWLKLLMPGLVIAGAAGYAIWQGWTRAAKAVSHAPNTLIAGDIMDTRPMKDLVEAVKHSNEVAERIIEAQDRTTSAVDRASAATDRNEAAVRDLCRAVERMLK